LISEEDEKWVKRQMNGREVVKNKMSKKLREETVYKYSNNGKGQLREASLIAGKPYFLKYVNKTEKDFLVAEPSIEEPTRKIVPPHEEEYPYEPYIFQDANEPNYYLQRAKKETIHSLYQKVKRVVKLFNDIDDRTLNLISADILTTYFQDRFSTVHYLIIVGENGTGKSAIADTFAALGYRVVVMTNPTKAIWYRVLGPIEYGQVTIVADESEGIEDSVEIMSILKDGYQTKHKVPRMDSDNKKPEWFYPFCIKIIICEKSPAEHKAKGLLDRSFKIKTFKGYPQYDIKEVRNPQGNKIRQKLLHEIEDLRKQLLVFRLYYNQPLPEIDINIDGRDKELCKPLMQLFYNTESQKEIEETLQYFIDIKNERKRQSLEAIIYPIIVDIVSETGNAVPSRQLWQAIIDKLDGHIDDNNPNVFYSTDYGKIYINRITGIATDKFGAERKHGNKSNSILVFKNGDLIKMAKIYASTKGIQTKLLEYDAPDSFDALPKNDKPSDLRERDKKYTNIRNSRFNPQINVIKTDDNVTINSSPELISASHASHASHDLTQEYPSECYYCAQKFDGVGKENYVKHVLQKHSKMPCYPGLADIKLHSLSAKGMPWEI
jgi:hypothetical protein